MTEANTYTQEEELNEEYPEQENEPIVEYDITSYPSDFTLDNLYSQWNKKSIVIPGFQRNYVWNIKQASLLIDSFMMGLPIPPVFFYLDEDNKYLVIDGQQRLRSIFFFFEGYFGQEEHGRRTIFKLTGLDERIRYAGKTYKDISEDDRRKLEGCVLRAINIRQITPSEQNTSVFHIFERLNTGGTALKPQEIRNCVFAGEFVSTLRELNEDENWRNIIGKSSPDKLQKDVEWILRLFALLEQGACKYVKPMKEFLNSAMRRHKSGDSDFVKNFKTKFPETCKTIIKLLGNKPFHVRGPINSAYLDSVFCTIYSNLENLPNRLTENYQTLKNNNDFNINYTQLGTQDTTKLKIRFKQVEQFLINPTEN